MVSLGTQLKQSQIIASFIRVSIGEDRIRLKTNLRCLSRIIHSKQHGVLQRPSLECFMRQETPIWGQGEALSRVLQMTLAARHYC
jgi:hypothetical protein